MELHQRIWASCLKIIADNVTSVSYKTWFEPIKSHNVKGKVLTIQVPSHFFYEYLEEHYIDLLRRSLRNVLGNDAKLAYSIVFDNASLTNNPLTMNLPDNKTSALVNKPMQYPLNVNEKEIKNPFVIPGIRKTHVDPQLNLTFTFDNFVEGDCNRLARSAGQEAARKPGQTPYNPILYHGESGLGKSHLAHAVGIEVKQLYPEKIVLYVSANHFKTQYTDAVRNNNVNDFIHFYQMIDVLIIDDVQEFSGLEGTQNTFFQIFNHLHQSSKQLILTCDRPPSDLKKLEPRLLSRFKWGLVAELLTPDFATRKAILQKKAHNDGIEMLDSVIDYIADNITTNVRELESALISLLARATFMKHEITLDVAKQALSSVLKNSKRDVSIDMIKKSVCSYFNLDNDALNGQSRKRNIVTARQIAMYLSKEYTHLPLTAIGRDLGNKNHATVVHAIKTISNLMDTDKELHTTIQEIKAKVR